jgi:fatty acid desaturase
MTASPLPRSFDPDAFKADLLLAKERVVNATSLVDERLQLEWFERTANRFVWGGRLMALACCAAVLWGKELWGGTLLLLCILLAAALTGVGNTARFGIVWHHSAHGGYEHVEGHARSRFAMGGVMARLRDWNDWILPEAWQHEHNKLHHYKLNEVKGDPDYFPRNYGYVIAAPWPKALKVLFPLFYMLTWKWQYLAVNTLHHWVRGRSDRSRRRSDRHSYTPEEGGDYEQRLFPHVVYYALARGDWRFALQTGLVLAPYVLTHLCTPLLVAWWLDAPSAVLWTIALYMTASDVAANVHSFCIIVTSHVGEDLYGFTTPCKAGSAEFYVRQILGSVSCPGNSDWSDFFNGGQGTHVEHHLFPHLSVLCYQRLKPLVQRVCARHGVPYREEAVWRRMLKLYRITVGDAHQPECSTAIPSRSSHLGSSAVAGGST